MSNNQNRCPTCGAIHSANGGQSLDCPACGLKYAFVEYFAGRNTYDTWNNAIQAAWKVHRGKQTEQLREHCSLIVGPEYIAFHDRRTGELTTFDRFGKVTTEHNVREYSVSNLHQVLLNTNGTVSVSGDTEGGRLRANGVSKIRTVLASQRCTHLVNEQGLVESYGACSMRSELEQWKDIRQLACGNGHLAGLTGSGTVVQAGSTVRSTADWKNVKAIAAASNYTLGLHRDGTVSYAGPQEEIRREIASWKNIAAIAADSQYAVGVTNDGTVLLAGTCKPYLDGGRSAARQWKNVACIGAGNSVIAAVTAEGELLLAGSFLRADDVIGFFRKNTPVKL